MDPTTQAHFDPLAAPSLGAAHGQSTGIGHGRSLEDALDRNPELTTKQPTVTDTSGLTTASVPAAAYPHSDAGHPGAGVNITNPFDTGSSAGTGVASGFGGQTQSQSHSHAGNNPFDDRSGAHTGNTSSHTRTGSTTNDTASSARDTASNAAENARDTTYNAAATARDTTYNAASNAKDTANNVAANARDSANNAAAQTKDAAYNAKEAAKDTANNAVTGIRQRARKLSVQLENVQDHPAVKNARGAANNQLAQIREQLGRSQTVRDLEKRTGVDRLILVFGGIAAYLILIPFNLLRLALPITTLLTILPASFLAAEQLDQPESQGQFGTKDNSGANDTKVKSLLSYFVVLGFIQTIESLMAGFLERRIPQYYTIKLLFLAYLLHPRTQGALKVHESVFRPVLAQARQATSSSSSSAQKTPGSSAYISSTNTYGLKSNPNTAAPTAQTPPTSKPSLSTVNSPVQPTAPGFGYGNLASNIPLPAAEQEHIKVVPVELKGQGYAVVNESL